MTELVAMLQRQAAWQRARADMSWTDKLRLAVRLRQAAVALRKIESGTVPTHKLSPVSLTGNKRD